MKILSIVIPAYNASNYLSKCLDSFLCIEHFNDLEVIIVNDGSIDNTAKIAQSYCEQYPNVYRLIDKSNGNVGSVYNVAFKISQGKYLKEVDADDLVDPTGLNALISFLKECNADIVLNNYYAINDVGDIVCTYKCVKNHFFKYGEICNLESNEPDIIMGMHATTYKASLIKNIPTSFDENCYYVDTEYNIYPLYNAKTYVALNFAVYKYLIDREGQSVSIQQFIKNIEQYKTVLLSVLDYYDKYLKNKKGISKMLIEYFSTIIFAYFSICLKMQNREKSIRNIKTMLSYLKNTYPEVYKEIKKNNSKIRIIELLDKCNYCFYDLVILLIKIKRLI